MLTASRVVSPTVSSGALERVGAPGRFDGGLVGPGLARTAAPPRRVVALADEGPALWSAASAIRQDGYRTLAFAGAETALSALPVVAQVTSVVVVAERLRVRSGLALVDALATVRPTAPTVLVSAHTCSPAWVGVDFDAGDRRIVARVAAGDHAALRRAVARAMAHRSR